MTEDKAYHPPDLTRWFKIDSWHIVKSAAAVYGDGRWHVETACGLERDGQGAEDFYLSDHYPPNEPTCENCLRKEIA